MSTETFKSHLADLESKYLVCRCFTEVYYLNSLCVFYIVTFLKCFSLPLVQDTLEKEILNLNVFFILVK